MSKQTTKSTLATVVGVTLMGSLALSTTTQAAENPFGLTELDGGYMQLAMNEGKCGGEMKGAEGKCGGDKMGAEGKCGGDKQSKEGSCGGDMKAKEGSCGESMEKTGKSMEGKCGEGKCGGDK